MTPGRLLLSLVIILCAVVSSSMGMVAIGMSLLAAGLVMVVVLVGVAFLAGLSFNAQIISKLPSAGWVSPLACLPVSSRHVFPWVITMRKARCWH